MDDCFRFGINDGCKSYCPVFEKGDCKTVIEDPEPFIRMIKDENLDEFEIDDIIKLYPQISDFQTINEQIINDRREQILGEILNL